MGKTPIVEKAQKTWKTPKMLAKRLNGTPSTASKTTTSKQTMPMLGFESEINSAIMSICTPGRTTRSMVKLISNETPSPSKRTPSLRKTIAHSKLSAKKSLINEQDAFVRPLTPSNKKIDANQTDDDLLNNSNVSSSEFDMKSKRKIARARKSKTAAKELNSAESSEDDVPKRNASLIGKSKENVEVTESGEEDLPSVSILGAEKPVGRYVRARKSKKMTESTVESSEDDLPSVSMLGKSTPGHFVRAPKSTKIENGFLSVGSKPSSARKSKKFSLQTKGEDVASAKSSAINTSLGQFARALGESTKIETAANNNAEDELLLGDNSSGPQQSDRNESKKENVPPVDESSVINTSIGKIDHAQKSAEIENVASNTDDMPSMNEPNHELVNAEPSTSSKRKSRDRKSFYVPSPDNEDQNVESIEKTDAHNGAKKEKRSSVKRSSKVTPNKAIATPQSESVDIEMAANVNVPEIIITNETQDGDEIANHLSELPKNNKKKPILKGGRISIIDLTESPMVPNKNVLNKTFSPVKEADAKNAMDRTFTEENGETGNAKDKTFSPIPSSTANKIRTGKKVQIAATVKNTTPKVTKSAEKGKSPRQKRLQSTPFRQVVAKSPHLKRLQQSTPFRKPDGRNNLNASAKVSSAKKSKMAETAAAMAKTPIQLKPPAPATETPIFKFGADSNNKCDFRFSMVSDALKGDARSHAGKSAVKSAPNFGNIHKRIFEKAESIDEAVTRHDERAKLLLSGKKPTAASKKAIEKEAARKLEKKREIRDARRPLANVNRSRLNDEERQDRRKQLFKQGRAPSKQSGNSIGIKGVRLNRRFELMMEARNKK